jgi:uncharacterized membrane protein YkoI
LIAARENEKMQRLSPIKVITFVIILNLLCFGVVFCQEENEHRVRMRELPKAVQETVREQSRGATIKGFSKETEHGQTYYEVEMKVNGHGKDVLIDSKGAVAEIEETVALESLPPDVRVTIEQNAGKGKVYKVEAITKNGALAIYEAVVQKGSKKAEIKVKPDGKLVSGKE